MAMGYLRFVFCNVLALFFFSFSFTSATEVSHDGNAIKIDGERKVIISGSIHYPRSTPELWPELIQKGKDGGLNAIETYVFWNIHEPRRREYDFEGNRNIIKFLKTIQEAGLFAVLRIGPYACAEWNYGGFPVWLHQMPGIEIRTDNEIFKNEMQNFTTLIVDMVRQEKLLAPQGGPIILTQIENEYGNIMGPYGEAGKRYIQWCAKMADSLDVGVPWLMCQQADAPQPMINTCNGFYCDGFKPNNPNSPKMWTENWTGWYKAWGGRDPHRPAEDVAFAVARFFQAGGTFQNYYMYHGGTNFGRTSGGPYITTSYDYDAPLDEYGNLRQPKWGHLKQLHEVLFSMEKILTHGDVNNTEFGNGVSATIYTFNGTEGCFLSNIGITDAFVDFEGNKFSLPAWSVSILPDCKIVVYNTAKVNTQTHIMVKKPNGGEKEPENLNWVWKPELIKDTLRGKGTFTSPQLLEQNNVTGGVSDYLWYMTSVTFSKHDPMYSKEMTLRVNTTGHVLYAFCNGKLVGSNYGKDGRYIFVLEAPVKVKRKKNIITLLSATVGLPNYGSFFDLTPAGIVGGPVQLIANGNLTKDLSSNNWTYKVGLNGEDEQIWADDGPQSRWIADSLTTLRPMTWYKTTFMAPSGKAPVVVDLQGLGKGHAWVNGQSLGRYWPAFLAPSNCGSCDYRGNYDSSKCANGCDQPTQRWYHVPRSFLKADGNSLILFEEMGGSPLQVNFQTVNVGTACASIEDGNTLELSCQGESSISEIKFASYGDPNGTCGSFNKGTCESQNALDVLQKACVGKTSCSISVSAKVLGATNCSNNSTQRLAVEAGCS